MAMEIVDLPSYKMVNISIVFCMFTRGYVIPQVVSPLGWLALAVPYIYIHPPYHPKTCHIQS